MNKVITARQLQTVVDTLKLCAANENDTEAAWHHKGIRVFMNALETTFQTVRYGQTVYVTLNHANVSQGFGHFFLPYGDLDTLNALFLSDPNAPIRFSRALGPLNRKPELLIKGDEWFETYVGICRTEGYPPRSLNTRSRAAQRTEIEAVTQLLRPLAQDDRIKVGPLGVQETNLQIVKPLPFIASVKCVLY